MHIIARMNVGGPAVEIAELMRGLDPQQISQRLVTGYCDDDEADYLETQATDLSATRINGLGRSVKPTDDAFVLARLTSLIRSSRPDIVHTHTAKAGVLGRIAAKASGTGTKIIHTHHGHLLHGYFGPTKTQAVILVERNLAKMTDRIITVGEKVRDDLLEAGIGKYDKYTVIRSGVRLGLLPDKQSSRRELGLPDGPVIVSMIGRLTQIKRPDRLADVAEITKQRGLNVHFLVAGGGDQFQALRERVEINNLPVTMLGWRSDLERILAATDIVLLTSDNEGVPISLIQAALAELPVVATRVGAVSEVVPNGEGGRYADCDSIELADHLMQLAKSGNLRRSMGLRARAAALNRFSVVGFLENHSIEYQRQRR
jgi:glycosyltransferase involved in cell wall biosynthesis